MMQMPTRISETWLQLPSSPTVTAEFIRILSKKGNTEEAEKIFSTFKEKTSEIYIPFVTNVIIEALPDSRQADKAAKYFKQLPQYVTNNDALDSAILARRMGRQEDAHRFFERAGDALLHDTRAIHEFAQTKIQTARNLYRSRQNNKSQKRLLNEAKELPERVIQMEADTARHAWAWRDLGRVKNRLKLPYSEVEKAYRQAMALLPVEGLFQEELSGIRIQRRK
jgi:ATP-dependent DNA helicase RecG